MEPVVADVHTQPTDLSGRDVGRILHIGVGLPRLMVVTAQTCQGPRAYAGVVSSYREQITDHWQRLDDAQWADRILGMSGDPIADTPWKVVSIGDTSVVMLYGDTQVTLTTGQGLSK